MDHPVRASIISLMSSRLYLFTSKLKMASKKNSIDLKTKYEIIILVKSGMKKDVRKKFNLKNRSNISRIMWIKKNK